MAEYYKHSGIVPPGGLIQTLLAGVGTSISLGIAYSYASVYIPFVYVHFLLTGAFGLVLGLIVKGAARSGRIRNRFVPAFIGLMSGLVGLYFAWGAEILARKMLPPNAGFLLAFRPEMIWTFAQWAYENGLWSIGRHVNGPVTGVFLAVVWLIEAAFIVGLATFFPWNEIRQWVFCENCGWWETIESNVHRFACASGEKAAERLKQGDLDVLRDLPLATPADMIFLRLHVATCETCDESNYLDLEQVKLTVDKQGHVKTKTETLVGKLAIAAEDVPLVLNAGQTPAVEEPAPETEPS